MFLLLVVPCFGMILFIRVIPRVITYNQSTTKVYRRVRELNEPIFVKSYCVLSVQSASLL